MNKPAGQNWPLTVLLVGALAAQTQGFRALGPELGLLIELSVAVAVFVKLQVRDIRTGPAFFLVAANGIFCVLALSHSLISGDRYITAMCIKQLVCALFFLAAHHVTSSADDAKLAIRRFADLFFWLLICNLVVALLVWTINLPPLFTRGLGQIQPRVYSNYIIAASEDNFRFISFFDEPSDFVWLSTSAVILQLYLRRKGRALFMSVAMAASVSGSLPVAYIVLISAVSSWWVFPALAGTAYYLSTKVDQIFELTQRTAGLDRLASRYFTPEGAVAVSRSDQFYDYMAALHFWPTAIVGDDILTPVNGSYLFLLRYGIVYAPIFFATLLLLSWSAFRGFLTHRLLGFFFVCQMLMFISRETPINSPLIWIPWLAVTSLLAPSWKLIIKHDREPNLRVSSASV